MKQRRGGCGAARARVAPATEIVSLDVLDHETLVEAGRLIWEHRGERLFVIGSQGVEAALVAYWRSAGLIPARAGVVRAAAGRADRLRVRVGVPGHRRPDRVRDRAMASRVSASMRTQAIDGQPGSATAGEPPSGRWRRSARAAIRSSTRRPVPTTRRSRRCARRWRPQGSRRRW